MNIKKIIKEEIDNFDWAKDIQPMEPGMEFLKDNFDNLKKVIKGDEIHYIDSERKPIFMYEQDSENGFVYINYALIWLVLERGFGLNNTQTRGLIKKWLEGSYNLKGFTPTTWKLDDSYIIEETYNLRT